MPIDLCSETLLGSLDTEDCEGVETTWEAGKRDSTAHPAPGGALVRFGVRGLVWLFVRPSPPAGSPERP